MRPYLFIKLSIVLASTVSFRFSMAAEIVGLQKKLGGEFGSTPVDNRMAYHQPFQGLSDEIMARHLRGDRIFETPFVSRGSVNPGLGVVFNNAGCANCHINDGIGSMTNLSGIFLKVSLPGKNPVTNEVIPVPGYGTQIKQRAIFGVLPECKMTREFETYKTFRLKATDENIALKKPLYGLESCYDKAIESMNVLKSPRFSPVVYGMGLLEAIADNDILAWEDKDDKNSDGIRGVANRVWDSRLKKTRLGRFGFKASNPSLLNQINGAFLEDMGVTTIVSPVPSYAGRPYANALEVKHPVLTKERLNDTALYVATLAVPQARRLSSAEVQLGARVFENAGCANCHRPHFKTSADARIELIDEKIDIPQLKGQEIWPYTDLLLHDMGEGLADNRDDFLANGQQWRTAPLWGKGLLSRVAREPLYLHDGRAKTVVEAILWHEGEAEKSRDFFLNLDKSEYRALLAFLESL